MKYGDGDGLISGIPMSAIAKPRTEAPISPTQACRMRSFPSRQPTQCIHLTLAPVPAETSA